MEIPSIKYTSKLSENHNSETHKIVIYVGTTCFCFAIMQQNKIAHFEKYTINAAAELNAIF